MEFVRTEINKGRQAYFIYPLIEESEKLNYENLMKGYENVKAYFPEPQTYISMVHGKMNAQQKEVNMKLIQLLLHRSRLLIPMKQPQLNLHCMCLAPKLMPRMTRIYSTKHSLMDSMNGGKS